MEQWFRYERLRRLCLVNNVATTSDTRDGRRPLLRASLAREAHPGGILWLVTFCCAHSSTFHAPSALKTKHNRHHGARSVAYAALVCPSTAPVATYTPFPFWLFRHLSDPISDLIRGIQRDLLLTSALLHQLHAAQKTQREATGNASRRVQVDARLYPAIVKLLDSVLQSLEQMRTLSIVDESPDLASAVDARLSYTKARRCHYLSWCYAPLKRYAEALSLSQHATIHLRECRSLFVPLSDTDAINDGAPAFYPLAPTDLDRLDAELTTDATGFKNDWFAHSGGRMADAAGAAEAHKKPLFFDIALNYVEVNMERLQERAGKAPATVPPPLAAPQPQRAPVPTDAARGPVGKAKAEAIVRPATPEPSNEPAKSRLGGLLGGWWGRS